MAVATNCSTHQSDDLKVIESLLAVRLKTKLFSNQFVGCIRYLIPYSAYILRVFNFVNFANLESFVKFIQRKLSHCTVTPMGNTNSRNLFNEFLQSSYSRKFRPAKYKRYTVSCF